MSNSSKESIYFNWLYLIILRLKVFFVPRHQQQLQIANNSGNMYNPLISIH